MPRATLPTSWPPLQKDDKGAQRKGADIKSLQHGLAMPHNTWCSISLSVPLYSQMWPFVQDQGCPGSWAPGRLR